MAKAEANCKCGKCGQSFTKIATKYNRREANEWVSWAEEHYTLCNDCYKAEKQAEEAEKIEKMTAEIAGRFELPELTGSEKQIKWATGIRVEKLTALTSFGEMSEKGIANVNASLKDATSARWWIDHRFDDAITFAHALMIV